MFEAHNEAVYEFLRDGGAVDALKLEALAEERRASGGSLAEMAIARGLVERDVLLRAVARGLDCEHVAEQVGVLDAETLGLLTPAQARGFGVVPFRVAAHAVDMLAVDPFNRALADDLTFVLGRDVRLVVAEPAEVARLIRLHYGDDEGEIEAVLEELGGVGEQAENVASLSTHDIEALASQAPVVRFVNLVLGQAIRDHASDIHFEPFEREFKIRYRIDGALYEMTPPPKALALPITSRVKVLANLDIAERRRPQDGRIKIVLGGRTVDLRVSTLPTQFGESVVLRVLDQTNVQLEITQLGMPGEVEEGVREIARRPNGIFVVTGPTGSGKTTTLYSALRLINTAEVKILTAEDPVEYEIDGIMQVPVNPAIGLTFASALRSFLRQDPDVIMVGEIRDAETAQVAIQASLTGHLVLSTLHTNDAAGAVTRLMDLGVEPFLLATTLEAVLAQRLVRRVCEGCRGVYQAGEELLAQLGDDRAAVEGRALFRGGGCASCGGTGYRGRVGLFEWLPMTERLRELVAAKASTLQVRRSAMENGMGTLRTAGLQAALEGVTTIEEVVRYT